MNYTTVYRTSKQHRALLLKGIFEQNNIRCRILEESNPADFPAEVKVQVLKNNESRALGLLKENGFISTLSGEQSSFSMTKFWLWLVVGLLFIILASFLINFISRI